MKSSQRSGALVRLFLLVCAGLCSSATFAQTFLITVDTSEIAGTNGYVDFQFNPADVSAPGASASISGGSITLFGAPAIEGSVVGTLPGTVSLLNSTAFNDYFHAVEFGDAFSFQVQFSGDFAVEPSLLATSFALSLYAADAMSPLLTNDVSGSIVRFELASSGVTFETFTPSVQVTPVPLPAAAWLLLSGLTGLIGVSRSRLRAAASN